MKNKCKNTGQIPDNPLDMPPPYWRSPGIEVQLTLCLEDIVKLLKTLLNIHPRVEDSISEYFDRKPDIDYEDPEFGEICYPLWETESRIKLKSELAIFLASIQAEESLNQLIVYNISKDIADSIEKLNPPEKLIITSVILTNKSVKGLRAYGAIRSLTKWRNSYAHGHCTDRPMKTLRHNHLIPPEECASLPKNIKNMLSQLKEYFELSNYLSEISLNTYTISRTVHLSQNKKHIKEIERYKFNYEEDGQIYSIEYK